MHLFVGEIAGKYLRVSPLESFELPCKAERVFGDASFRQLQSGLAKLFAWKVAKRISLQHWLTLRLDSDWAKTGNKGEIVSNGPKPHAIETFG